MNVIWLSSRLKLSPSPSSHSTATQAASQGRRFLHGKKRKIKETKKREHSAAFKTIQHVSASGNISIEEIDADGKFVRLKNHSNEVFPFSSLHCNVWLLRDGFSVVTNWRLTLWHCSCSVPRAVWEVPLGGSAGGFIMQKLNTFSCLSPESG